MTDNVSITSGTGTLISTDEVGGVQVQRVKIQHGADGSATDVSSASPLPVTLADGGDVTLGAKADAKSTATDTTAVTAMSVWKQISASVQAIAASLAGTLTVAAHAVTQSGTWTVQPGNTANTTAWKIDGSAVTQPVSIATAPVLVAGSAVIGKVGIDQTTPGTTNLVALAANQSVNLAQVGGTNTVNGGVAGSQSVGGTVATNVAITANPVNLGAQAVSSENAAVTTARQVQLVADLVGKLIVLPYANPENFVSGAITSAMTGTTTTSLIAAPASGLRNYITQITVSNAHATVGTDVIIQDGSGGTTLYTIPAAAVYGGAVLTFPTPLRQPTTATAIYCANVTTGASTKVSASGYKGA